MSHLSVPERPRAPKGFTLVEMLIALTMFGMVIGVATQFMLSQSASINRTAERTNVQQNARAALTRISSDIRVVGQGLNLYNIQVPDMIVPNDGTVGVNVYDSTTISLISVPENGNQLSLDPVVGNGAAGSTSVNVAAGSLVSDLAPGERVIFWDPNTGNSQVVALTGLSGLTLDFTADPLIFAFPSGVGGATPTVLFKLNEVRYRVNTGGATPFLERKVNRNPWTRYIDGIQSITFTYFDAPGNRLTPGNQVQRRAISRVDVIVTGVQLRRSTANERPAQVTLTSSAVPRNMLQ